MALKSCICGGEARMKTDDHGRYRFATCAGNPSCGRSTIHCRNEEEAEEIWNDNRHHRV